MTKINLSQYQFSLRDPYSAGHVMTELDANVLNFHRADNIRKLARRWVVQAERDARDAPEGVLSIEVLDAITKAIADLDNQYKFTPRIDPPTPAFDHQLWIVATTELAKEGAAHLMSSEDQRNRLEAAIRDPGNRARARRVLISHLKSIYGHVSEEAESG